MTLHLNGKNACGLIAGVCVVVLAAITVLIPADKLSSPPGRWLVLALAAIAIIAIAAQMFKQSREDDELGKRLAELMAARGMIPDTGRSLPERQLSPTISAAPEIAVEEPSIDGEVYRLVSSPRSVSWELVRDVYRIQGRPQDASIDCDVLVELYLVNRSKKESRYVRDLKLSAELIGGGIVGFKRQDDLLAMEFNNTQFEYGLEVKGSSQKEPIKQLFSSLPFCLSPTQAIEGWVRFMADTNPDNLKDNSFKLWVVDSLGEEHLITTVATRDRKGEVGLRRASA